MNRRLLWMLFVFCRSEALRGSVLFTDVGAALCVAVILGAMKVIDFGAEVYPHDGVRRAVSLRLALLGKLIRTRSSFRGRARARRCGWGCLLLSRETGCASQSDQGKGQDRSNYRSHIRLLLSL